MNAVIQSFLEGKKKKQGNGQTDGRSLFLFGNLIARTRSGWAIYYKCRMADPHNQQVVEHATQYICKYV
jgi:hypothetical protein